jgi:eukaryotic-like serine/threonine-protein kinase
MSSAPETLPAGTLLAGKLRVVRRLGAGGMGAVYEIEHEITKHRRALKVLHRDVVERPGAVERFLREASAAGRIGDPHVVETFDAGTLEGGEPYVVLELLSGETLGERIEREGRLQLEATLDIMAQACEGVEAAHAAGIVHRDLKPDNLFLVPQRAAPPFVKLLDFGISKFTAESAGAAKLTGEGMALGTPLYMSPEQVRGEGDVDGRADVYALGVILYECVSGEAPFEAASLPHLMVLIHEGRVTPLAERRPDLPTALYKLVARAMATEREQRLPSARALRDALRAIEADLLSLAETAPGGGGAPAPGPSTKRSPAAPDLSPPRSPDLHETAIPASTVPPPARISSSVPPRPSSAPPPQPSPGTPSLSVPPAAAVPAPAGARRRSALVVAGAAALAVAASVAVSRLPRSPAASASAASPAPASPQASSEPRALAVEPVASAPQPHVEPAPPPVATVSSSPTASSRPEHPLPAKPLPTRTSAPNRVDQAGLAKSPFQ